MSSHQRNKVKTLKIRKKCKRKILAWAKSKYEIGFLCAGKKKKITHVFQIRNISESPLHRFKWDRRQKKEIKKKFEKKGLSLVAEGHSHPHKRHLKYPSLADLKYFNRNRPHLIAFPRGRSLQGWMLQTDIRSTLKSRLDIRTISD